MGFRKIASTLCTCFWARIWGCVLPRHNMTTKPPRPLKTAPFPSVEYSRAQIAPSETRLRAKRLVIAARNPRFPKDKARGVQKKKGGSCRPNPQALAFLSRITIPPPRMICRPLHFPIRPIQDDDRGQTILCVGHNLRARSCGAFPRASCCAAVFSRKIR